MARDEFTDEPDAIAEHVADAAIAAAEAEAEARGVPLAEVFVIATVRLDDDGNMQSAAAGTSDSEEAGPEWLTALLLFHLERVFKSQGREVRLMFTDEIGQG